MQRAKTTLGLFAQYVRLRWSKLGRGARFALLFGVFALGAASAHFGARLLGAGCASGPCSMSDRPCHGAMSADDGAPCPYSRQARDEAADEADTPPCHAR
ncbi:MAG: hypothetical protein AB7S26_13495 [Sandaracinaceae bacterium]